MFNRNTPALVALVLLVLVCTSKGQDLILGLPPDPGFGNCAPFGCGNVSGSMPLTEYQQVYDKSLFPGPITITAITFFNTQFVDNAIVDPAHYTLSLSTAFNPLVNDFKQNIGCDSQVFFDGTLGGPVVGGRMVISGTPFLYDPALGPLVLDVAVATPAFLPGPGVSFDERLQGGGLSHGFLGFSIKQGVLYTGGLVTGFTTTAPTVPKRSCLPTTLDPVPGLLSGPAVTTDVERLASLGRPVKGASADGVTQLVVRIPAHNLNETFALTVLSDPSSPSTDPTSDGVLAPIGSSLSTTGTNTLTVSAVSTASGPTAFALYRAPLDFARADTPSDATALQRQVSIAVQSLAIPTGATVPITIVRPPLVLVHGNWSGPSEDWAYFQFAQNPSPIQTYRADYSSFLDRGVTVSAAVVLPQVQGAIETFKTGTLPVAAIQADLVAYSLGGLVSRALVSSHYYRNSFNYQSGYVHKLITLDTPHLGSELASALLASGACKTLFSTFVGPVAQNIIDMAPNSALLKTLSTFNPSNVHLPAAAIASNATAMQQDAADSAFFNSVLYQISPQVHGPCRGLLPAGGYQELFRAAPFSGGNDLIVSTYSQMATGLGLGGSIPAVIFNGLIHDVNPHLFPVGPDVRQSNLVSGKRVAVPPPFPSTEQVLQFLNAPVSQFRPIAP